MALVTGSNRGIGRSTIIEFAKANSIRVCCEGIESENELNKYLF